MISVVYVYIMLYHFIGQSSRTGPFTLVYLMDGKEMKSLLNMSRVAIFNRGVSPFYYRFRL